MEVALRKRFLEVISALCLCFCILNNNEQRNENQVKRPCVFSLRRDPPSFAASSVASPLHALNLRLASRSFLSVRTRYLERIDRERESLTKTYASRGRPYPEALVHRPFGVVACAHKLRVRMFLMTFFQGLDKCFAIRMRTMKRWMHSLFLLLYLFSLPSELLLSPLSFRCPHRCE